MFSGESLRGQWWWKWFGRYRAVSAIGVLRLAPFDALRLLRVLAQDDSVIFWRGGDLGDVHDLGVEGVGVV